MQTHKDLDIWKLGIDLVELVYNKTREFPDTEKFSLTSQMRRSAIAIPSNIAEGYARKNVKELIQFLYVSLGSLSELETQVIISKRLGYLLSNDMEELIEHLRRMLLNLIKYHRSKI